MKCPFKIGDWVVYRPSQRGAGLSANDPDLPKVGETVRICDIVNDNYLVIEGYPHPGGGLYWTEFAPADSKGTTR
jgi:hypothetical protein